MSRQRIVVYKKEFTRDELTAIKDIVRSNDYAGCAPATPTTTWSPM